MTFFSLKHFTEHLSVELNKDIFALGFFIRVKLMPGERHAFSFIHDVLPISGSTNVMGEK